MSMVKLSPASRESLVSTHRHARHPADELEVEQVVLVTHAAVRVDLQGEQFRVRYRNGGGLREKLFQPTGQPADLRRKYLDPI